MGHLQKEIKSIKSNQIQNGRINLMDLTGHNRKKSELENKSLESK